jgi:hypothetical protein
LILRQLSWLLLIYVKALVLSNMLSNLASWSHMMVLVVLLIFIFYSVWVLSWKTQAVFGCSRAIRCDPNLDFWFTFGIWSNCVVFKVPNSFIKVKIIISLYYILTTGRV